MKENAYNFLKGAKLHLCCSNDDFRPAMNNIYFDEGHAIATDGHILICADLHDISNLNDEEYYTAAKKRLIQRQNELDLSF